MKLKNLILTGLVLVLGTSLAFAQPGEGKRNHEKFFEKLNLSDTQKQQLKDLRQNSRKQTEDLRKSLKDSHDAMRKEFLAETPDMAKINQIKEQIKTLEGQLVDTRVNSMIQTRKILSAEQFEKMSERWKEKNRDLRMPPQ